jgi:rubrerythrin
MSKEIKEERLDPEVFKTAVTSFLRKIHTLCNKHEVAGECYTSCPLYGKSCGITRHATEEEIDDILNIISKYEDEEAKVNRCSCGYIFNNDTEYRFCPFCGASKEEAD